MVMVNGILSDHDVGGSNHPRALHEQFADVEVRRLAAPFDSDEEVILVGQSAVHDELS